MSSLPLIDSLTLAFWSPGPAEMLVLAVVALLLYGGNLPEVARSWGKSFAEFRRGLSGIQNDLNDVIYSNPERITYDDKSYSDKSYSDKSYNDKNCNQQSHLDENCRDDTYVAEGYVERADYQEEGSSADRGECGDGSSRENIDENATELDESEKTVGGASADTVVLVDTNSDTNSDAQIDAQIDAQVDAQVDIEAKPRD